MQNVLNFGPSLLTKWYRTLRYLIVPGCCCFWQFSESWDSEFKLAAKSFGSTDSIKWMLLNRSRCFLIFKCTRQFFRFCNVQPNLFSSCWKKFWNIYVVPSWLVVLKLYFLIFIHYVTPHGLTVLLFFRE